MKKGSILEIDIENYAFEGKGVARIDDENSDKKFVIFAHGYPGDKLKVRIARKKKSYAEATVLEILEASPLRKKPDCNYFGVCGGCKTQDLEYSQQLLYKQEQVVDALRKIGGFEDLTVEPIVPADKTFFYRNKMEFSFTEKRWLTAAEINTENDISDQKFALGLHVPKVFEKVINIEECLLQSEISNRILNFTRDFFKTKETSIYSTFSHEGFLRNLVIRQSYFTDDLMVNLVTAYEDEKLITLYTNELLKKEPSITTIVNSINTKKAAVAFGEYHIKYFGDGFITDKIDDFQFRISPNSFFQTNSQQAESLYKTVLEFAELKSTDVVYDLYCGAGTISIFISKYVKQV
ncbi:MAG: 23S rRNA (uracil(1939)-C(5))-methyltransferase RlmD, partial [Melioribacteraceae bacterium]|nr:23S rRNA (uracil(1939)-C(5))-methyltransferase RlmD [Melioribacteraceae bacterium]